MIRLGCALARKEIVAPQPCSAQKIPQAEFQWIVSGGNGNQQQRQDAMDVSSALGTLVDVASGRRMMVSYNQQEWNRFDECAKKAFAYLGLDYKKDFTINGMKFTWDQEENRVFSKTYVDAKNAYEMQAAKNRTYEFADEKTKREIEHRAWYYTKSAPDKVQQIFIILGKNDITINPFYMTDHGISISSIYNYVIYYGVILILVLPALIHGRRSSCHYICWMAPFMVIGSTLGRWLHFPQLHIEADKDMCISCGKCNMYCPMGLDVKTMVSEEKNARCTECIQCGACIDACPKKVLKYNLR